MDKLVIVSTLFVFILALVVYLEKHKEFMEKISRALNLPLIENYGTQCSKRCKKTKNCRESFKVITKDLSTLQKNQRFSVLKVIKNIKPGEKYYMRIYWKNQLSKAGMDNALIDVINSMQWGDYLTEIDYLYSADTQNFCIEKHDKIMKPYDQNTRDNNAHILLTFTKNTYFPTLKVCDMKFEIIPKKNYRSTNPYGREEMISLFNRILQKMFGIKRKALMYDIRSAFRQINNNKIVVSINSKDNLDLYAIKNDSPKTPYKGGKMAEFMKYHTKIAKDLREEWIIRGFMEGETMTINGSGDNRGYTMLMGAEYVEK